MRQRARNQQETRWAHIMRFVTDTTPLSAFAAVLADLTPRRRRALQGHIGEARQWGSVGLSARSKEIDLLCRCQQIRERVSESKVSTRKSTRQRQIPLTLQSTTVFCQRFLQTATAAAAEITHRSGMSTERSSARGEGFFTTGLRSARSALRSARSGSSGSGGPSLPLSERTLGVVVSAACADGTGDGATHRSKSDIAAAAATATDEEGSRVAPPLAKPMEAVSSASWKGKGKANASKQHEETALDLFAGLRGSSSRTVGGTKQQPLVGAAGHHLSSSSGLYSSVSAQQLKTAEEEDNDDKSAGNETQATKKRPPPPPPPLSGRSSSGAAVAEAAAAAAAAAAVAARASDAAAQMRESSRAARMRSSSAARRVAALPLSVDNAVVPPMPSPPSSRPVSPHELQPPPAQLDRSSNTLSRKRSVGGGGGGGTARLQRKGTGATDIGFIDTSDEEDFVKRSRWQPGQAERSTSGGKKQRCAHDDEALAAEEEKKKSFTTTAGGGSTDQLLLNTTPRRSALLAATTLKSSSRSRSSGPRRMPSHPRRAAVLPVNNADGADGNDDDDGTSSSGDDNRGGGGAGSRPRRVPA